VDRRRTDDAPDVWDVPFFDDGVVRSAQLQEDAGDVRTLRPARIAQAQLPAPQPAPVPVPVRWSGLAGSAFVIAVVALAVAALLVRSHLLVGSPGIGSAVPPASREESPTPLAHPPAVAFPSTSYQFELLQAGSSDPVTYDPCRPIHYVLNHPRAPNGAAGSVQTAVAAVSAATGLRFIDDGTTTEAYSKQRPLYQPSRYGARWAPVLIDFTSPTQNPEFGGGVIGIGGSSTVRTADGHRTFVTGSVDLDADAAARLVAGSSRVTLSSIVEHELGHVVGLAHVQDPSQLMYPSAGHGVTSYGSGDLTGLARLGAGRCEPTL
jgi:hypothetical protein